MSRPRLLDDRRGREGSVLVRRRAQLALAGLIAMLVALLVIGILAARSLYHSAERRYVQQALPLRSAARDVVLQMLNEETAVRGYLITADRPTLKPYFAGRYGVTTDLSRLQTLSRTHPRLAARVRLLRREIRLLNAWFARQIAFVADGPEGRRRAQRNVLGGSIRFDRFRKTAALIGGEVDRLVAETRTSQHRTFTRTLSGLIAAGAVALVIAGGLLVRVPERLRAAYAAEEEARARAELGANAARALEHIDEAVVLLDDDGTVRFSNQRAAALLGTAGDEAVGAPASDLVRSLVSLEQDEHASPVLTPVELGGHERWLRVGVVSFEGGRVLAIADVTAEHELEQTRTDLVVTASHELRTPVTAVYGAVQTLRARNDLPEEQRQELMSVVEHEAGRLATLIDQILTTAQLDEENFPVVAEECDVYSLCAEIRAGAASSAGVAVNLEAPATVAPLRTDPQRLRQVVTNLVDNAVKYSPPGSEVAIRIQDAPDAVRIQVLDRGIGIAPEKQERIFEKFYRADPDMAGGVGGTGLGLYIAREITSRLGGRISLESKPGVGSTFTLEMPRD